MARGACPHITCVHVTWCTHATGRRVPSLAYTLCSFRPRLSLSARACLFIPYPTTPAMLTVFIAMLPLLSRARLPPPSFALFSSEHTHAYARAHTHTYETLYGSHLFGCKTTTHTKRDEMCVKRWGKRLLRFSSFAQYSSEQ